MRALKALIIGAVVAGITSFASPTSAVVSWEFSQDSVSLGLTGVSPHVERTGSADRLWYPGGTEGTVASDCNDAGSCTRVALTSRLGNDFTAVTLADGTRRAYFVDMSPNAGTKTVASAACTTSDCLGVGLATPIASDVQVSKDERPGAYPTRSYFPTVAYACISSCPR